MGDLKRKEEALSNLSYEIKVVYFDGAFFIGKVIHENESFVEMEDIRIILNMPEPSGKVGLMVMGPPGYNKGKVKFPIGVCYEASDNAKSLWLRQVTKLVMPTDLSASPKLQ